MEAMNKCPHTKWLRKILIAVLGGPDTDFALLLADLENDQKHSEREKELMADPRFPKADQIYFVPK